MPGPGEGRGQAPGHRGVVGRRAHRDLVQEEPGGFGAHGRRLRLVQRHGSHVVVVVVKHLQEIEALE